MNAQPLHRSFFLLSFLLSVGCIRELAALSIITALLVSLVCSGLQSEVTPSHVFSQMRFTLTQLYVDSVGTVFIQMQ